MPHRSSFLGFPCQDCKSPIVALTIPRENPTPSINSGMVIKLMCPACRSDHLYETIKMVRFEAAQIGAPTTGTDKQ